MTSIALKDVVEGEISDLEDPVSGGEGEVGIVDSLDE